MSSPSDPPPEDPSPDAPPAMSLWMATLWAFGITLVFQIVLTAVVSMRPASANDMVVGVACQAIVYLGGAFLILRVHAPEGSVRDYLGLRPTHALFYLFGLLLGLAVHPLADAVEELLERRFPITDHGQIIELYRAGTPGWRAGMVVASVFFGPILEEMLFRGVLYRGLRRIYPMGLATIMTAWFFGAAHMRWQAMVTIGLVGLVLGWLRAKSGSIVPTALAHMAFNAVSVAGIAIAPEAKYPLAVTLGAAPLLVVLLASVNLVGARSAMAARAREIDLL
jgi:hypothetical protein